MIPMDECVERGVYEINSRNLLAGVYDGKGGFIGIRLKFKSRYLFTEYHWDTGTPYGTVQPIKLIEMLPEGIEARERYDEPTTCSLHGRECKWAGPPIPSPWIHVDDGSELSLGDYGDDDERDVPVSARENKELFDYLDPIDQRLNEERRLKWEQT